MKKQIIIAAAAFSALLSCTKYESFVKGQEVTLKISVPEIETSSALSTGGNTADFRLQKGDKIKVTVNGVAAEFTLIGDGGSSSAEFVGTMPEGGETFDVQYPYETPSLSEQVYSATQAIPRDKMLLKATGCTVSNPTFELKPQYSVLKLNLWGAKPVSRIVVSDCASSPSTYTLTCGEAGTGIALGETQARATPFFIVVPAGSMKFTAEAFNETPLKPVPAVCVKGAFSVSGNTVITPSEAQTFEAGEILDIPAEEVVFAKKVYFTKGNLYYSSSDSQYHIEAEQNVNRETLGQDVIYDKNHVCHFYWANSIDWQTPGREPWAETYSYSRQSSEDKFFCGVDNPMTVEGQSGLYALTGGEGGEYDYLFNTRANASSLYRFGVSVTTAVGTTSGLVIAPDNWDFTTYPLQEEYNASSTPLTWSAAESLGLVCLPAGGIRNDRAMCDFYQGYYWSSTPFTSFVYEDALHIAFRRELQTNCCGSRKSAMAIRLVVEAL